MIATADSLTPTIGSEPKWGSVKLKNLLRSMGSGGTPNTDEPKYWAESGESGTPWVAIADMSRVNIVTSTAKRVTAEGLSSKGLSVWPKGTLLMSMYASLGHVAILGVPAATNQAILALHPRSDVDSGFLGYWLMAIQPLLKGEANSNTQDNLNAEKVANLPATKPSFEEQRRIAAFLDYETARIDELVHEQERLRNLVDSKRTAVIRHYVTKGVVTGVASKDSGVEWIGTVPNHWQIDRVKWSQQDVKGGVWGSEPNGDEWDIPCVRVADFDRTRGEVHTPIPTMRNIPVNERVGRVLRKGDLVLEKSGGGDSQPVGYVVLYSDSQPAVCSNFTSRIQLGDGMHPSYWRFVHRSLYSVRRNVASIKQTSGIQNLDVDAYCDELVPFPPAAEQVAIAQRIEAETYALDRLVIDVGQAIRLLLERRSALISAAVTGQLDLRDWQPPEPAAVAGVA